MNLMNICVLYLGYPEKTDKRLLGGVREVVSKYTDETVHEFTLCNGDTWATNALVEMVHHEGDSSYYIDILHSWKVK